MDIKQFKLSKEDAINLIISAIEKGNSPEPEVKQPKYSKVAIHLLSNVAKEELHLTDWEGKILSKSELDEITLDFTRTRTLSEEKARIALRFIVDNNPYMNLFNTRVLKKLVEPVEGRAITQKNLISNEQAGGAVPDVNRRPVHNFGINLWLKHSQMQVDIPYQTVIDNLENPGWDDKFFSDVSVALGNDILMLALLGLGGNYSSSNDFYDLNLGLLKMLQVANGLETNSYGQVKVSGFLAKHLTPHKVDWYALNSSTYNAAALHKTMRVMHERMPAHYRNNPNIVFMMSQVDFDLYQESRSAAAGGDNTIREGVLTSGEAPTFLGRRVVALPYLPGLNETHEGDTTLYGAIILGDPKNFDIAVTTHGYKKSENYNARGTYGPVFEYTWDVYNDFQLMTHDSFVIAFRGAAVETPYFVDADNAKNGSTGLIPETSVGVVASATNKTVVPYCDTRGAVIVKSTTDLSDGGGATYATLAAALAIGTGTEIVPEGVPITLTEDTYFRAYMRDGSALASGTLMFDKT